MPSASWSHSAACSSTPAATTGYRVTVPRDAVCTFEGIDADEALEYLVMAYGADVTDVAELTRSVASAHA
jgi:nicotinamidase-related amidase